MISKKNILFGFLMLSFGSLFSNNESCKKIIKCLADRMYCIAEVNGNSSNEIEKELGAAAQKIEAFFNEHVNEDIVASNAQAFLLASSLGDRRIMNAFINAGFSVNYANSKGQTPLMMAAYRGNIEVVQFLCEHGADVTLKDSNGLTAQDYARLIFSNKIDILSFLPIILIGNARYKDQNCFEECDNIITRTSRFNVINHKYNNRFQ